MTKFLLGTVIVLVATLALTLRYSAVVNCEKNRLLGNQTALLAQQREYKLRDSLNAVSVGVLMVKTTELQRGFNEMCSLVRDMDLKLKRVESISQTTFEGRYDITAAVRDTLMPHHADTVQRVQVIRFSDTHMDLEGVIADSMFHGSVTTRDTLTQILHRIPRRFLFIRWGTKELRQEIVSSNPHTYIIYNRTIRVR